MGEISGKQLLDALKKNKITQQLAAESLGVTRQTVSNWGQRAVLDVEIINDVKTKLHINLKPTENQFAYEIDAKGISNDYLQRIIAAQEETISSQKELINALKEDTERLRKENTTLTYQLNTYK